MKGENITYIIIDTIDYFLSNKEKVKDFIISFDGQWL